MLPLSNARVRGQVRGYQIPDGLPGNIPVLERVKLWDPCTPYVHNDLMYDWAVIVQRLLRGSPDGKAYSIGGMYLEFNNGGTVDPVPSITRDGWATYYNNLNSSEATRDYLRVPLIATSEENTDDSLFSYPNKATFIAQTVGVGPEGIHGLTFSDANSSYVYGGALVAFVDDDPDNDIVFNRFYFAEANQLEKLAGRQLGISWPIILQ